MKKVLIIGLLQKFEQAAYEYQGVVCWSARGLQKVFNYADWRNFLKAIDKAKNPASPCRRICNSSPKITMTDNHAIRPIP